MGQYIRYLLSLGILKCQGAYTVVLYLKYLYQLMF
jgi:hypothetical protein